MNLIIKNINASILLTLGNYMDYNQNNNNT
jgi:hypothetical protein